MFTLRAYRICVLPPHTCTDGMAAWMIYSSYFLRVQICIVVIWGVFVLWYDEVYELYHAVLSNG